MEKRGRIKNWLWLGMDRETAEKYQRRIARDNIRIIKNESLVVALICSVYALFFLSLESMRSRGVICFVGVAVMFSVYLYSHYLFRQGEDIPKNAVWFCMGVFIVCAYVTTIYLGTFASGNEVAVTIVCMFVFMPTNFDILPKYNLLMTLSAAVIFLCCSYLTKTPNKVMYDVMDAILSVVIGNFVAYEKAKIRWESVRVHEKLEEERDRDILTGIWNRRAFEREVGQLLQAGELESMAVIMLDLDKFKRINDNYGHEAGDAYICHFCGIFKEFAGRNTVVGRRSGDEFFMFIYDFREVSIIEEKMKNFYRKLENNPIEMPDGTSCVIRVSVGAVWTKNIENEWSGLLCAADEALYYIKENGRNSYVIEEYGGRKYSRD